MRRALALAGLLLGGAVSAPAPSAIRAVKVQLVAPLTGPDARPSTKRADVCGTDLGLPASLNGTLYLAFGDTFGYDGDTCAPFGPNWRSNVLGWTTDADPSDGLTWSGWHAGADGRATAVVEGAHQPAFTGERGEQTRIPTALIALGGQLVLHTMSVHGFAQKGGEWTCNFSQFVVSGDRGRTWQPKGPHVGERSGTFNMLALSKDAGRGNAGGRFVYILGTPCGRFGDARLARAPADQLTNPAAWRYYAGHARGGAPLWSRAARDAVVVVRGPFGEASLSWNAYLNRWTSSFFNERSAALELRDAPNPWGPWSAPHTLATARDYPQLYGAFTSAALQRDGGRTVYFVMSQYGPYNTYLMRADLTR